MGENYSYNNTLFILSIILIALFALVPFIIAMIKKRKSFYVAAITGGAVAVIYLLISILRYMAGMPTMGYMTMVLCLLIIPDIVLFIIALKKENRLMISSFIISLFLASLFANYGIASIVTSISDSAEMQKEYITDFDASSVNNSTGMVYLKNPDQYMCTKTTLSEEVTHPDQYTTVTNKTIQYDYKICKYSITYETTEVDDNDSQFGVYDYVSNKINGFIGHTHPDDGYIFDFVRYGEYNMTIGDWSFFRNMKIHYLSLPSGYTISNSDPFNGSQIDVLVVSDRERNVEEMRYSTSYLYSLFKTSTVNYIVPLDEFYINNSSKELLKADKENNVNTKIILGSNRAYQDSFYFFGDYKCSYELIFDRDLELSSFDYFNQKKVKDNLFVGMMNDFNLATTDGRPLEEYLGDSYFYFLFETIRYTRPWNDIFEGRFIYTFSGLFNGLRNSITKLRLSNWFEKNKYYTDETGLPLLIMNKKIGVYYSTPMVNRDGGYDYVLNHYVDITNNLEYVYRVDYWPDDDVGYQGQVSDFHIIRQGGELNIYLPEASIGNNKIQVNYYNSGPVFEFLTINELHFIIEGGYSNRKIVAHSSVQNLYFYRTEDWYSDSDYLNMYFYDTEVGTIYRQ